jgi:hypothetical protein
LEWTIPSPPPHDNFAGIMPTVYHGPYEFSVPGRAERLHHADRAGGAVVHAGLETQAGMAATATSTNQVVDAVIGGGGSRGRNGNGFRKNGGGHGDDGLHYSPARYRLGIWVAIASIVMLFTALTSAYIVRMASSE